jgi:hypothetical protein
MKTVVSSGKSGEVRMNVTRMIVSFCARRLKLSPVISSRLNRDKTATFFMTDNSLRKIAAALSAICALAIGASAQSGSAEKDDVIRRARGAYYNLTTNGLTGFKANIHPNWEVILGPTATQQNLKVFRTLQFSMTVDASGTVTVSHEVVNPEKIRVEPYVNQIYGHVNRLVTSFFGTWAAFVVSSPFPETGDKTKIENAGNGYHLFHTTPSADVMLTLTSDLLITEWKLTNSRGQRTVKPLFQKTTEGLLLAGYHSAFEPTGEGIKSTLDLRIEYQEFSGLKLPHKIQIKGIHGSEPVEAELEFSQYVLNPR